MDLPVKHGSFGMRITGIKKLNYPEKMEQLLLDETEAPDAYLDSSMNDGCLAEAVYNDRGSIC